MVPPAAPTLTLLLTASAMAPAWPSVPPLSVSAPEPRAALLPSLRLPLVRVVPPL